MSGVRVVTLGCRLNAFESEVAREGALAAGLDDAVIVNTCAVTAEAERQARQTIRRLRRERPEARIIVTGCAAQLDPQRFAAMPEVDRVVGNAEKLVGARLAGTAGIDVRPVDAMAEPPLIGGFEGRARAFVQVQQGCDHRCTFCIVPFARGRNRSLPPERVAGQVARLVAAGYREAVLTGVDVSSWGAELPGRPGLGALVRHVLDAVPGLARLRLTSLDPAAVDEEIFRLLADEPRFMPHLHLSVQAGDALILKRMGRRHAPADVERLCAAARRARPDVVLGADLIAGFPTETEAAFANTVGAVGGLGFTFLHVFPYSERPGTPAARMPMVPVPVRRERAAVLRAAGEAARRCWLAGRVGAEVEVLVEDGRTGHDRHYAPVRLDRETVPGSLVRARVTAAAETHLDGEALA